MTESECEVAHAGGCRRSKGRPLPLMMRGSLPASCAEGESFPDLLQRLDAAIGKALKEGVVTNEINGGRFRLAPSGIRKKR